MSDTEDANILSRWSRRKLAAREQAASQPVPDRPPEEDAETIAARNAELQANRDAAEAIDLDRLDEKTDFSVFMKEGVPELLRRQAMAVLWRSNPVFANVDGLVDYGEDYGRPELIMKTFKSAWQAGRGYLKDKVEEAGQVDDLAAADANPPAAAVDSDPGDQQAGDDGAMAPSADADESVGSAPPNAEAAGSLASAMPDAGIVLDAEPVPEPEPLPRVSLRRRLMLDGDS
jgi:hypothetical protein